MKHLTDALRHAGIESRLAQGEIRLNCPACADTKFKLYFNTNKRIGYCFRCNKVYSPDGLRIAFKLQEPKLTAEITDAMRVLSSLHGDAPDPEPSAEIAFPDGCVPAWKSHVAKAYLRGRGISVEKMRRYVMHYCDRGRFENRIILPVFDHQGHFRYFGARSLDKNAETPYLYPKHSPRADLLFPEDIRLQSGSLDRPRILVEGYFDAIHLEGEANALMSTHISDTQVQALLAQRVQAVAVMLDADIMKPSHPSHATVDRLLKKLQSYFRVKAVVLEHGDPDDHPVETLLRWTRRTHWLSSPEEARDQIRAMMGGNEDATRQSG